MSTPQPRDLSAKRSAVWNTAHNVDSDIPAGVQSINRSLVLLNLVGLLGRDDTRGVRLADLTRAAGWAKPTVHRVLTALVYTGFVEQDQATLRYRLGVSATVLGQLASQHDDDLLAACRDSLVRLALLSEDTTFLTVRQGSYGLCVHREEGTGDIRNHALAVGDRHPLGVGAGSLAILAALPDAEIDPVMRANAPLLDRHYPLLAGTVLRELTAQTRNRGYSLNSGRVVPGSWAIGAAIRSPDGRVIGALSIATIEHRLGTQRQHELAAALHREIAGITASLAKRSGDGRTL